MKRRGVPRDSRSRRRWRRNLGTAVGALAVGAIVGITFQRGDLRSHLSAATAYVGFGAVALSLMLGPLKLLRRQPNPVSSDLRRDLGVWGATVGLVHVGIGLTVHFRGRMQLYFLPPPDAPTRLPVRVDPFGIANHLGLVAGLVLLILLGLSSDRMLRRLGAQRWKAWQRLNYFGALAIVAHGAIYQILEKREWDLVALFIALAAAALALQGLGALAVRRKRSSARR